MVERVVFDRHLASDFMRERISGQGILCATLRELGFDQSDPVGLFPADCRPTPASWRDFERSAGATGTEALQELAKLVSLYLNADESRVALFVTFFWEGDRLLKDKQIPYVVVDRVDQSDASPRGVWFVLRGRSSPEIVEAVLRQQRRLPFALTVLVELPDRLSDVVPGQYWDRDAIAEIVALAKYIAIGAFDDETKLVWGLPDSAKFGDEFEVGGSELHPIIETNE